MDAICNNSDKKLSTALAVSKDRLMELEDWQEQETKRKEAEVMCALSAVRAICVLAVLAVRACVVHARAHRVLGVRLGKPWWTS